MSTLYRTGFILLIAEYSLLDISQFLNLGFNSLGNIFERGRGRWMKNHTAPWTLVCQALCSAVYMPYGISPHKEPIK